MKSSNKDTSRERETNVNTESTPPPKKTRTEKETEKGAETRAETEGVKEMSERVAIVVEAAVAGQSAVSARREMAGLIASAEEVEEMNL